MGIKPVSVYLLLKERSTGRVIPLIWPMLLATQVKLAEIGIKNLLFELKWKFEIWKFSYVYFSRNIIKIFVLRFYEIKNILHCRKIIENYFIYNFTPVGNITVLLVQISNQQAKIGAWWSIDENEPDEKISARWQLYFPLYMHCWQNDII